MAIVVSTGQEPKPENPHQRRGRRKATLLVEGVLLLVALLFGLLFRLLAYEGVLVTSGSMEPTARRGDYFLVDHRVALRHSWQRGDIVIFDLPPSWSGDSSTLFKRIIGLPGETISVLGGRVMINGQPLPENYFPEVPDSEDLSPVKLGEDEYFMMGDNRRHSDDSRDNGPVEEKYIRGRVVRTLWPLSRFGPIVRPDYGPLSSSQ